MIKFYYKHNDAVLTLATTNEMKLQGLKHRDVKVDWDGKEHTIKSTVYQLFSVTDVVREDVLSDWQKLAHAERFRVQDDFNNFLAEPESFSFSAIKDLGFFEFTLVFAKQLEIKQIDKLLSQKLQLQIASETLPVYFDAIEKYDVETSQIDTDVTIREYSLIKNYYQILLTNLTQTQLETLLSSQAQTLTLKDLNNQTIIEADNYSFEPVQVADLQLIKLKLYKTKKVI